MLNLNKGNQLICKTIADGFVTIRADEFSGQFNGSYLLSRHHREKITACLLKTSGQDYDPVVRFVQASWNVDRYSFDLFSSKL